MNSLKSSLTFAIIVFVNPPCQHTQQRNYGECAEDGTNNAATAIAIHRFSPAFSRYLKKCFSSYHFANLIRFHSFNFLTRMSRGLKWQKRERRWGQDTFQVTNKKTFRWSFMKDLKLFVTSFSWTFPLGSKRIITGVNYEKIIERWCWNVIY